MFRQRQNCSLGEFAATAYQTLSSLQKLKDQVAERERAEHSLREEQESLRLACDVAGLGTWQFDICSRLLLSSEVCKANFGLGPGDDLTYARFFDLIHIDDRERVKAAVQHALQSRSDYKSDYRCVWPDGSIHWVSAHGRTFYAPDGKPLKMVGVTLDITERQHAEEQFCQTQKWESLGVLAGGIAHDFNNLLTGILGNASLLVDETAPGSRTAMYAQGIVEASERAAHLTKQMLAYSGRGHFMVEQVDLSDQVRKIFLLLHAAIPKNVVLRMELAADLPLITFDVGQLQQLVTNFIQNAAEAIEPPGNGTVILRTKQQSITQSEIDCTLFGEGLKPGSYVTLEVSDTGMGMDEATVSRIFDPFFTTKFTGRGLGLAAVSGIIKGHKGALRVDTTPGQGTTFAAFFPAPAAPKAASPQVRVGSRTRGTILVVDDEEIVRKFVKPALEAQYDILLAENGREAVSIFEQAADKIAVVVLDLKMPVMSGDEVLPLLKRRRADIKVILTSGYDQEYALGLLANSSAAGFLKKPYQAAELQAKIREILQPQT